MRTKSVQNLQVVFGLSGDAGCHVSL